MPTQQRLLEPVAVHRELEVPLIPSGAHGVQPARHNLGVAIEAARRDFGAPGGRIPSLFSPLDTRRHADIVR